VRTLLAGLIVVTLTGMTATVVGSRYPAQAWPWWGTPLIVGMVFGSVVGARFFFKRAGGRFRPGSRGRTTDEQVAELKQQGLLLSESFHARKVFQVAQAEDEGPHYFIELTDGAVLYLNGQYLYDYAREAFPCSQFTVWRHKVGGFVVAIECAGVRLSTEWTAPPFDENDDERDLIPDDGQILRDRSYDQLKRERMK
jgi:hypothetical protein